MGKLVGITFMMAASFFVNGQDHLEKQFQEAISFTRYGNIYNRIIWDSRPTNEYEFDQSKGTIRYQTDNPGIHAVAQLAVLGTFNLTDSTFLWADKNNSIQSHLSREVATFRQSLPEKYQPDKFLSNVDWIKKLLALFSYRLRANGSDFIRQDDRIIFFALTTINVFENNHIKSTIDLTPHFDIVQRNDLISIVKQFHNEMFDINAKLNNELLTDEEAMKAVNKIHLKYWLNEDDYYSPSLCWPCDFAEESTRDWAVIKLRGTDRVFVVYTSDFEGDPEHHAYEISKKHRGNKMIIAEF